MRGWRHTPPGTQLLEGQAAVQALYVCVCVGGGGRAMRGWRHTTPGTQLLEVQAPT